MLRGHIFDENLLMIIAALRAISIQELPEAVGVMLFFQIGELFQGYSVGRSRRSIAHADKGIARGGLGADAAIGTADVVTMTDAPSKVAEAI
jgi:cation transport ATPase